MLKMLMRATALAGLVLAPQQAGAQAAIAEESAAPIPTIAPLAIAFDEDGLSGDGGMLLRAELGQSQIVLVGEAHGFAGPPMLVMALAAEAERAGTPFDAYAVETGPHTAAWLSEILANGGVRLLGNALQDKPLAVPFLTLEKDAYAAIPFAKRGTLWGIDQEFVGAPLIFLPWLLDRAPDAQTRQQVSTWLEAERAAFAKPDPSAVMMMRATSDDWAALADAYAGDETALPVIAALARSSAIYRHFLASRQFDNNTDRIALIRETFLSRYLAAQDELGRPPRVIMKLGAMHTGRGTSPLMTYDIGSLVEGMAAANGGDALHILFMPLSGKALGTRPSAEAVHVVRDYERPALLDALRAAGVDVDAIAMDGGYMLVPLEPVRRALGQKGLEALDPDMRFMILGHDYLVTTRNAMPGHALAGQGS